MSVERKVNVQAWHIQALTTHASPTRAFLPAYCCTKVDDSSSSIQSTFPVPPYNNSRQTSLSLSRSSFIFF